MLKAVLLSLALFLVPVSVANAEFKVSAEGCQQIGMVVARMVVNQTAGKPLLEDVLTEAELATLNPEIQEHLKLIALIVQKYPEVDPRDHFESYVNFCFSAQGDVALMNQYIVDSLKVQSI